MSKRVHPSTVFLISVLGLVGLLVGVVTYLAYRSLPSTSLSTLPPTPSPTYLLPESTVSSLPLPNGEQTVPATVRAVIANFYSAYTAQDKAWLFSLFTPDQAVTQTSLRLSLEKGEVALPLLTGYTILSGGSQDNGWIVTVREERFQAETHQREDTIVLIRLLPGPLGEVAWLIDGYTRPETTGKYSGFLFE